MPREQRACNGEASGYSLLVMSLGLLAVGCGAQGEISGTVQYKGKHLTGGIVTFLPPKGEHSTPKFKRMGATTCRKSTSAL